MISTDKIPRHSEIFCHSHHAEILNFPRICGKINRLFRICEETEVIILADFRNEIEKRRTFAIISHPDAGKTTLTEKFLLYGGAIQPGRLRSRAKRRRATPFPTGWKLKSSAASPSPRLLCSSSMSGYCINILDTPGHQDFSEDTYRTLMAADSAVMVIDASKGVEAQTRKLFKVCVMRAYPDFHVHQQDGPRRAAARMICLDEIEKELGIGTYPDELADWLRRGLQGRLRPQNKSEILAFEADNELRGQREVEAHRARSERRRHLRRAARREPVPDAARRCRASRRGGR